MKKNQNNEQNANANLETQANADNPETGKTTNADAKSPESSQAETNGDAQKSPPENKSFVVLLKERIAEIDTFTAKKKDAFLQREERFLFWQELDKLDTFLLPARNADARNAGKRLEKLNAAFQSFETALSAIINRRASPLEAIKRIFAGNAAIRFVNSENVDEFISSVVDENGENEETFKEFFKAPRLDKQELFQSIDDIRKLVTIDGDFTTLAASAATLAYSSLKSDEIDDFRIVVYKIGEKWYSIFLHKEIAFQFGKVKFVLGSPSFYMNEGRNVNGDGRRSKVKKANDARTSELLRVFVYEAYKEHFVK